MKKFEVGSVWYNRYNTRMVITEFRNKYNITVRFDSGVEKNVMYEHLERGNVLSPNDELIYGIIYMIKNNKNGRIYIGKTKKSFNKRYASDLNLLKNKTHNIMLKMDIEEFGIENFTVIPILDKAFSEDELDALEHYYIEIYQSSNFLKGYNIRK